MSTWHELQGNPRLKKIYAQRVEIIRFIREFFWSQGFVETDTPLALRLPSQEPHLNFFPLTAVHPSGQEVPLYLRTSPEFALKKLLAAGFSRIFEMGKCFRNVEDFGGTHNPEFTMIEWYRAPGTLEEIMNDVERLFKYVGEKLDAANVKWQMLNGECSVPINGVWQKKSMKEVWREYVGAELDELLEWDRLAKFARARGYQANSSDAYEDLFFKIFLNEIEPKLGFDAPVFVYDYPKQMCSLSRASSDPRYAERFELYIAGLEIANAFGELTDAAEQKERLEQDRALRQKLGKPTWPVDPDFIAALESGIPEAGGVALGVDRMVVLFTGAKDINEVLFNSMADQLEP